MLRTVSLMLVKEQELLYKKVPALKDIIPEFIKKEALLYKLRTTNPHLIQVETSKKKSAKEGLVETLLKLIAVTKASAGKGKVKVVEELDYTYWSLMKLSTE